MDVDRINKKLDAGLISASRLLTRFVVLNENVRETAEYSDPRYFLFYYHLGTELAPKTVLDMSIGYGFASACFLNSCKTVEMLIGFQNENNILYSEQIARKNIRFFYKNKLQIYNGTISQFEFLKLFGVHRYDLAIINDEMSYDAYMSYLRLIWPYINENGSIILDRIHSNKSAEQSFLDFCKVANREGFRFNTKYGVGIITK